MRKAIVNVDLDFFTKPQYEGNYFSKIDWTSKSDFKAVARKWMRTDEFVATLPMGNKFVRGCIVKENNQPLSHWNQMIDSKWLEPKMFDIIHFDAHHDMYMWHDDEYYHKKQGIADYRPFEAMIAPLKMGWVNNIIWVHPDYIIPDIPSSIKRLYPNSNVKAVQWSDWNWNNHEMWHLSVVTNPDMCIMNEGMIEDFDKIIQRW